MVTGLIFPKETGKIRALFTIGIVLMDFQDARHGQILALTLFLLLGVYTRDWTLEFAPILVFVASCWLTQLGLSLLVNLSQNPQFLSAPAATFSQWCANLGRLLQINSLKSATITAMGLCLLLRSNHLSTLAIASCLAIGSKFILQVKGKHLFNPSNFGIIAALVLTQDAWVSPGQWGADCLYLLLFLVVGGLILKQVGRWDTSIVFIATYGSLLFGRNTWLGWGWDVSLHQLMSGSLLLFTFFMITDPRSIPNSVQGRIIWASAIALLTFILQFGFFITTAPFWALFCLSPLTLLMDYRWAAPRFHWLTVPRFRSITSL
jgi:hypothetical protein